MNYSMLLCLVAATLGHQDSAEELPPEVELGDALEPALQRLRQLLQEFSTKPVSAQAAFDLEHRVQTELRELGRVGVEWAYNHVEPSKTEALPAHVEFEGCSYTRVKRRRR
jgi:hypothetical protein